MGSLPKEMDLLNHNMDKLKYHKAFSLMLELTKVMGDLDQLEKLAVMEQAILYLMDSTEQTDDELLWGKLLEALNKFIAEEGIDTSEMHLVGLVDAKHNEQP